MRKSILALTVAALVALPGALAAQGFGIAGRIGTVGVGGEAALALSDVLVVRGGISLMPVELSTTISNIAFTIKLPETWYNVGVDLYLGPAFRFGAGILFKPDDPTLTGTFTGPQTIGNRPFTAEELGTLTGVLDSKNQAPYVLIGFGNHTASGIGLFLDVGIAFLGDPTITLEADGTYSVSDPADLETQLNLQVEELTRDIGDYLNYWPFINLGLRIGLGG